MKTCLFQREPVSEDYENRDPEHRIIYRFVRNLFNAAQLTAECAIVTLVSRLYLVYTYLLKFFYETCNSA